MYVFHKNSYSSHSLWTRDGDCVISLVHLKEQSNENTHNSSYMQVAHSQVESAAGNFPYYLSRFIKLA